MSIKRWASRVAVTLLAAGAVVGVASAPAQAAVPDKFGFLLWSGGFVTQAQPAGSTVVAGPPGRWTVTFPGQGIAGGVVHVTAVHDALANPPGRWCQADSWGVVGLNEVVKVSCYSPFGALDPTPGFSVQFSRSSGAPVGAGRYGYIHANAVCGIITQYNSAGFGNTCTHAGVGAYSVGFTAMGTPGPIDGGFQVTAVNGAVGARCKIAGPWTSSANGQFARIFCFNPAGALANTAFTVSYQYRRSLYGPVAPPNRFGYLLNQPPVGPASTNFNNLAAANGIVVFGPPVWTVRFPNIYSTAPSNTQVTAFGTTSHFCGLHKPWQPAGTAVDAHVNCFTNAGVPVNSGFLISHNSRA
ncbi:hypothetical protein [Catelliglobosispora koreensis]|uniref:hypothetical protein n=1 Tax=Catelliglobosispora koreensis TaxID=129052 RepID=UPI00036D5AF8|nr:hypothetical protein [Catelliglobosispora koreensis]